MTHSLETLTVDAFQPRIGETFRIRRPSRLERPAGGHQQTPRPDHELEAELIEARALGGGPSRAPSDTSQRRTPFSLSFRTSLAAPLPQSIYEVAHDELGSYEIFLVPVGPDGKGMVYQAIFT